MQLPVKAHYAAQAMLALAARHQYSELLAAKTISNDYGIPNQFLGQILQQLRTAGLITSVRGSSGGFKLARSPSRISMADIIEAVGYSVAFDSSDGELTPVARAIQQVWQDLSELQTGYLQKISLAELTQRLTPETAGMFYI